MSFVFFYGFKGVFSGAAEYEYRFPVAGIELECILFLSQQTDEVDFENAKKEILNYGFKSHHSIKGNNLSVESLNSPAGKKFQPYYEEALDMGSSIAIY